MEELSFNDLILRGKEAYFINDEIAFKSVYNSYFENIPNNCRVKKLGVFEISN